MYEPFYGLRTRPFCASLDPDWFVAAGCAAATLAELLDCARDGRGIGVLCGESGLGKSHLCRRLARDLSDEFFVIHLDTANFPNRRALLQAVLFGFGRSWEGLEESELRLATHACARDVKPLKSGALLVVDEAHLLDEQLLDELRVAATLTDEGRPLFRIVLSGQVGIDEMLARPGLDAFRERIGCQASLERLSQSESADYLARRIALADGRLDECFSPDAVRLICHAADGAPRALNHLADHVLLVGYVHEQKPAGEESVRMALDDLRRLPIRWNEPAVWTPEVADLDDEHIPCEADGIDELDSFATHSEAACAVFCDASDTTDVPAIEVGAGVEDWGATAASPQNAAPVCPERLDAHSTSRPCAEEEIVADPWPLSVARPDVFEASPRCDRPVEEVPRENPHPVPVERKTPSRDLSASDDPRPEERSRSRPPERKDPSSPAPPHRPVPHFSTVPQADDRSAADRPADAFWESSPRGTFDEEPVVDRYALLDSGRDAEMLEPRSGRPADRRPEGSASVRSLPQRMPDALIDAIVPMVDAALSLDGGPTPTVGGPAAVQADLRRSFAADVHQPSETGPAGDDDLEHRIGMSVLESCLETQRAIVDRLGEQERREFDAGLEALHRDGGEEPRDLAAAQASASRSTPPAAAPSATAPAAQPADVSPVRARFEAQPARQYSQLFSALRKKYGREG